MTPVDVASFQFLIHHMSSLMEAPFSLPLKICAGSTHRVLLALCTHPDIIVPLTVVQLIKMNPMSKRDNS